MENKSWIVLPPYLTDGIETLPEIEEFVRFYCWYKPTVKRDETIFTMEDLALVDTTVFKVFDFEFLAGHPGTAFKNPYSIVLTESTARKLLGNDYSVGKTLHLNNRDEYTVTAIVKDIAKFHMSINAFASVHDHVKTVDQRFLESRNYNFHTFLLLSHGANLDHLMEKLNTHATKGLEYPGEPLLLRPFGDIYFANHLANEGPVVRHGNMNLVIVFSIIAFMILTVACINFINLNIAESATREKEIAIRKTAGAGRGSIQNHFFGETFLLVLLSFLAAIVLVNLSLPAFNLLIDEPVRFEYMNKNTILLLVGTLIFTTFLSGIYPSLYLSSLSPNLILKGGRSKGGKTVVFSQWLITFQFAASILLIIATITVLRQLHYMQNKDLGFDKEQVITFTLRGSRFNGEREKVLANKEALKQSLASDPRISSVTFLNQLPGEITNTSEFEVEGEEYVVPVKVINADPEFKDMFGLQIVEGRNFDFNRKSDDTWKFILNEEAVKQLKIEDPIGHTYADGRIEVIGVVKDFHFNSLHSQLAPMAIRFNYWTREAAVKVSSGNLEDVIQHIRKVYGEFCPGFVLEYDFLDDSFARQYLAEQRLEHLLSYFVGITIFLSCMGLFALTAFIARQRTKEIGIRKVLGSSNSEIVMLLSANFVKYIALANLIAWPIAYFVLVKWLDEFAYHIKIGVGVFVISGLLALAVALFTIGYQSLKVAFTNPAESLRYE
jgi:putative ABC transport system permease protein